MNNINHKGNPYTRKREGYIIINLWWFSETNSMDAAQVVYDPRGITQFFQEAQSRYFQDFVRQPC